MMMELWKQFVSRHFWRQHPDFSAEVNANSAICWAFLLAFFLLRFCDKYCIIA